MATKAATPPEASGSSKAVRDAVALSKESSSDSPDGSLGKLSEQLIKSMANDVAFMQVQSQKDTIEANSLEAKKKKLVMEQEIGQLEQKSRISAPVAGLGGFAGVGPIGMQQLQGGNAEVIKAALSALESDEARLKYLDANKHLLYGGAPGMDAFASLVPKKPENGGSEIAGILAGLAQMQLAQGQEQRNSLYAAFDLQSKLKPSTPVGGNGGVGQSEDTKLMVAAMLKLAESFAGGQNQMQQQIAQIRDEKVKSEQMLWEKYFEAQRQADDERRKNQEERYLGQIGGLQEKLEKLERSRLDEGGVRGELAQLRNLMEKGKEFGLNLTNKTPDEDRAQREYDLELARLNMQKEMMVHQQESDKERMMLFNNKVTAFGSILALGYDAMQAKKKLQKANPQTVNSLGAGI